jgi:hypothetical protein
VFAVQLVQPEHPIAYGYPAHTYVFRENYAVYAEPKRWLRMAYCNTCLVGAVDDSGVVTEWGIARVTRWSSAVRRVLWSAILNWQAIVARR